MPFSKPVHLEWCDDDETMKTLVALLYLDPRGRMWTVPAGFITDGASIPAILWSLIGSPFTGDYRLPAIFHDCAYCTAGVRRGEADRMFYDAMREAGVSGLKAALMYAAVRIGGGAPYRAAQKRAEQGDPHHQDFA